MVDIGAEAAMTECGWNLCFTTANDAQLQACFRAFDAQQRGNDSAAQGDGWIYNCTDPAQSAVVTVTGTGVSAELQPMPTRVSAARGRAVVAWAVVWVALAAVVVL